MFQLIDVGIDHSTRIGPMARRQLFEREWTDTVGIFAELNS